MKYILFSLVSYCILFFSSIDHDLHLSKMDLKYDTEEKAIQIVINVFVDDLEAALAERGNDNLKILTEKEAIETDSLILDYFYDMLDLEVDREPVSLTFVGKESSEDFMAAWCYLEVPDVENIKKLTLSNQVLLDQFDDQRNVVIIKKDRKRVASFIFDDIKQVEEVTF